MLLQKNINTQGISIMEVGGGTEILKIIFYLIMLWFLHWFSTRSSIILGLWKMMYGSWSLEVRDSAYWMLVVDIYDFFLFPCMKGQMEAMKK